MQRTLSIEHNGETIVSKPFDFEAVCLIDDIRFHNSKAGIIRMCHDALNYLFDGTDATADIMKSLPVSTQTRLCRELWDMFIEAFTSEKNV